ncbi:MAG: YkoP family protein [Dehalococcoidia bacterium]
MSDLLLRAVIGGILPIINRGYTRVLGIRPLNENSIISIELRRHKGRPVRLEDGCEVRPGDRVIKLHLNNAWIAEGLRSGPESGRGFPRGLIYYFRDGLRLLAAEVADGKHGGLVAVYGWTAFHGHAGRLGFQVIDLPDSLRIKLAQLHISALMQAHHIPWLRRHSTFDSPLDVKAVWLSRAELLRLHGPVSSAG